MNLCKITRSIDMGRTFAIFVALVLATGVPVAQADTQCYDFSGPAIGTKYHIGDTVNAKHSVIHLQKFRTMNGPSESGVQEAEIIQSNLPQGEGPPSLKFTSIVAQVVPQKKVKEITMKYAENVGVTGQHTINFGVNGERRVLHGTLGQLDGQILGDPQRGGKVKVSVTANPDGNGSYWIRGNLTLRSIAGPGPLFPNKGIQVMAMGEASQFVIDDYCITE